MKDHRTPEQIIRAIMEAQANAATLEYGTDIARDTYLDDTPGQEPGEHKKKHATVLGHNVPAAVDGIPGKGGEMAKPNPERLAGLGKKESYQGNPYLQIAKQDIISESAFEGIVEMSDVEFDDMIEVLTLEELNDLEEGIMGTIGKGIGAVAKGAYKAGKYVATKTANRLSTAGRADAAEKKLKKLQKKRSDRERLQKAKQGLKDFRAKDKPINISFKKPVADSYELNKREYWTEQDEQDLAEGKMSSKEVKKHAAAIWKMRQDNAQKAADKEASSALKAKRSKGAVAARRDAAAAGYGKPKKDSADIDVTHKPEKRGRGQKDLPHIVSQLRGVVDTKDGAPSSVKFKDGTTKNVKPKHAQSWLKKHDSAKPGDKLKMYKSHDSHKSFKSYAKEELDIDEAKVKNCGCGQNPCVTYGSKEQQMQEAQRRWDRSSKGRAYRRLSDEEKARLMKKNELIRQMRAYKGDDESYESKGKMRKPTVGGAKSVYRGKKTRREQMEGIILGIEAKFLQENEDIEESFKHYEVTHKPSGKKYKVTAMHDKSAKEKARAQHGGTASRYSGTSTDDFHTEEKMAGVEYYPRMKKHGKMSDAQKKAVTAVYDKKKVDKKMSDDPHVKKAQRYMKVEQAINELSGKTLSNYIQKAANPTAKKSAINLASRGAWKLAKSADHDLDAGEKEDAKAYNRGQGMQRAAIKLQKKMYSKKNEYYDMHHGEDPSDASITRKTDPGKKGDPKPYSGKYKKDPKTGKMVRAEQAVNELSTDLINKVAAKRRAEVSRTASEYGYTDYRNPNYKKAVKKADKNQRLTMRAGARKIDKFRKSLKSEATAAEVLKKRYASYHADDNPQATRKLKPSEHNQPKGANVYKMHPGAKLTDRGYSKKGKMAALKKQHARRPEQYGITKKES